MRRLSHVCRSGIGIWWFVASLAGNSLAATYYVSPSGSNTLPYDTWQTAARGPRPAVAVAVDGDTVVVSNGIYPLGRVLTITNGIHLQSVNGWSDTVLKGTGTLCLSISHSNAVVEGFSIQGGGSLDRSIWANREGGGVFIDAGVLRGCEVRSNYVSCSLYGQLPCPGLVLGLGGGVYASGLALVEDCVVRDNVGVCFGGGLYCAGDAVVRNCLIYRNQAVKYEWGPCRPDFPGNVKDGNGGGVYAADRAKIINCTIADNSATHQGGGVYVVGSNNIINSVMFFNDAAQGPNIFEWEGATSSVVRFSCATPVPEGEGNTGHNPQFVNLNQNDFRLRLLSPCLDTGSDADAPATDMNGVVRPQDGDQSGSAQSDMGAYEAMPGTVPPALPVKNDFDGDRKADPAVYHAASGNWYIQKSSDRSMFTANWGWSETQPVAGDYDGDYGMDLGAFLPRSGDWYILKMSNGSSYVQNWGWKDTEPFPGDYDGDGISDPAVFHKAKANWYMLRNRAGSCLTNWGWSATLACPGDFDGDGMTDLGVFHSAAGNWYVWFMRSNRMLQINWGWNATTPVPEDYDGDGVHDFAVFARTSGNWYIIQSSDAQIRIQNWGWNGTTPVAADYDGDGLADLAVFDQPSGNWYILQSTDNEMRMENWGWNETIPAFFQRGK